MEKKALLLFSHQLTENQAKELMEDFEVKKILNLPTELQEMWSNVSIKENYMENLEKIKKYIDNDLIPVYSYTERNVEEIKDGENVKKISYFKHIKFIKYR